MSNRTILAQKLAKQLIQENQKNGRTWRVIAFDYPDIVKPGTLNRIAKSNGAWLPKSKKILMALGLREIPAPTPEWLKKIKKQIAVMAKQTRQDLGLQK